MITVHMPVDRVVKRLVSATFPYAEQVVWTPELLEEWSHLRDVAVDSVLASGKAERFELVWGKNEWLVLGGRERVRGVALVLQYWQTPDFDNHLAFLSKTKTPNAILPESNWILNTDLKPVEEIDPMSVVVLERGPRGNQVTDTRRLYTPPESCPEVVRDLMRGLT